MNNDSNIGEIGVDSIRIGGHKVENLRIPLESIKAKEQLPEAAQTSRMNKVANIKKMFPEHDTDFLKSKVAICRMNISKMKGLINGWQGNMMEYTSLLSECKSRDKALEVCKTDEARKEVKARFCPYQVGPMEKQIKQFQESINEAERVIDREHASIEEFSVIIAQCDERDRQLKELGETV